MSIRVRCRRSGLSPPFLRRRDGQGRGAQYDVLRGEGLIPFGQSLGPLPRQLLDHECSRSRRIAGLASSATVSVSSAASAVRTLYADAADQPLLTEGVHLGERTGQVAVLRSESEWCSTPLQQAAFMCAL